MALSTHLHSSRLIRLLRDATPLDMNPPRLDFAERLGLWLSAVDTVRLHAALQPGPDVAPTRVPSAGQPLSTAMGEACQQLQAQLSKAILTQGAALIRGGEDLDGSYAPYRKRHLEQQRQMEVKITPLRAQLRQGLAKASPPLRQLATLDAVLEQTLGGREQKMLALVPVFLEKHFEQLRRAHTSGSGEVPQAGKTAPWLADFGKAWQAVVLAELDLRLQPLMGLMEAWRNEVETQA